MKKIFQTLALAAAAALVLAACNKNDGDEQVLTAQEKEMKTAVEQYVPGVIYSIYGTLADKTSDLCDQFAEAKTLAKAGNLTDAKVQEIARTFLDAREYWEKSEAFLFGAATEFGIDPHIDDWPLDLNTLSKTLSNVVLMADLDKNGADKIGSVGESSLGFHGLEYIIFRDGQVRKAADIVKGEVIVSETDEGQTETYVVTGLSEIIFAAAVSEDLRNACWRLQVSWDPNAPAERKALVVDELELPYTAGGSQYTFGESLLRTGKVGGIHEYWQETVTKIFVDGMQNICDEVAHTKIATAHSQNAEGEHDPSYIESPYSQRSYFDFKDNILSIQYSLYGKADSDANQKGSLLSFLEKHNASLASTLKSTMAAALKSLDDCIASGVPFVKNPESPLAGEAIDKIDAFNNALGDAADYFSKL